MSPNFGFLDYWILKFGICLLGNFVFLVLGFLELWFIGLLVYWFIGLLELWFIGLLVFWFIGDGVYVHHELSHLGPGAPRGPGPDSPPPQCVTLGQLSNGGCAVMEYTFTTNFHIWAQGPPRAPGPTLPPQNSLGSWTPLGEK